MTPTPSAIVRGIRAAAVVLATSALAAGCTLENANAEGNGTDVAPLTAPPASGAGPGTPSSQAPATFTTPSQSLDDGRATAIVRATARVAPAVVSVNVIRTSQVRPRSVWESLYMPPAAERRSASFGSGVIVSEDGIVLTNDHVITGASRIRVTLPGGRDLDAELIGTDPVADIAVLRIQGDDLPIAPVGTAEGLLIGEWAIAIGNPLGNYVGDSEPTVTAGVISALNRNIAPSSEDAGFYFGMIQTDAAINPGNSGGALVNAAGEVIGINASIISRSGGSEGLGFAIPIDRALQIAQDFREQGQVRRAWVGLEVEPVEADEWGRTRGVRVSRIAAGTPADAAALEVGDRLLVANGRPLTGPLDWEGVLLDLRADDFLSLSVQGRAQPVQIRAVSYPSLTAARVTLFRDIELISVTPQIQLERGLVSADGALIANISPDLARRLGLQLGDVIVQMNRTRIRSADDAARFFDSLTGQQGQVIVYLERNGNLGTRNLYWRG
ncbi:MAG: trypsin-like peptidase domain-containing protein [Gemmatimonadota bacterium]|nr:trypsin-like peptidase domain-containing protein [Gemmatimonadota bacterium]